MYNRYVPQPDGSFRRSRMQDRHPPTPPRQERRHEPQKESCPPEETPTNISPSPRRPESCPQKGHSSPTGIGSFLRQLLPKDFDTSDLLIVILLLLMAGDCAEDQNTALLTLALYLFM